MIWKTGIESIGDEVSSFVSDNLKSITPSGVVGETIASGVAGVSLGVIGSMNLSLRKEASAIGDKSKLVGMNLTSNILSLMSNLYRYYFFNPSRHKPAAMLAGIPLGTVSELSMAMSDQVLKFRSKGGIFLAHQKGGNQTLRIEGFAWGLNRFMFLNMLDLLFIYGQGRTVDMFQNMNILYNPGASSLNGTAVDTIRGTSDAIYDMRTDDPWTEFNIYALDEGRNTKHFTFPVITRDRIYTSMYIETYECSQSIAYGMNVIKFTLFLRKYTQPLSYRYTKIYPPPGTKQRPKEYYSVDQDDETAKKLAFVDLWTEIGMSVSLIAYRYMSLLDYNRKVSDSGDDAEDEQSSEEKIAMITSLGINNEVMGSDMSSESLKLISQDLDSGDSLLGLSVREKVELFQVD